MTNKARRLRWYLRLWAFGALIALELAMHAISIVGGACLVVAVPLGVIAGVSWEHMQSGVIQVVAYTAIVWLPFGVAWSFRELMDTFAERGRALRAEKWELNEESRREDRQKQRERRRQAGER